MTTNPTKGATMTQAETTTGRVFRRSVPVAPRLDHQASQDAIDRIRALMTQGLFVDHA